jgi:hypothetical protein
MRGHIVVSAAYLLLQRAKRWVHEAPKLFAALALVTDRALPKTGAENRICVALFHVPRAAERGTLQQLLLVSRSIPFAQSRLVGTTLS